MEIDGGFKRHLDVHTLETNLVYLIYPGSFFGQRIGLAIQRGYTASGFGPSLTRHAFDFILVFLYYIGKLLLG